MEPLNRKHKLLNSFKYAFHGVWFMLRTQRNAQIHVAVAGLVTLAGIFFKINSFEWILLVFAIGLVLAAEQFNTAIEFLTDLVSPGTHEKAGRAKDISAGAVLVCAITAVVIGMIIFLPKLL
jgi:diacylglycerol kinase (ATP)